MLRLNRRKRLTIERLVGVAVDANSVLVVANNSVNQSAIR